MAPDLDVESLVPGFLEEARHTLESIADDLAALDTPDHPSTAATRFTRATRALHTIKGTAACLGLSDIAEAAHHAESRLVPGRAPTTRPDAEAMAHARQWLDRLASLCARPNEDALPPPSPAPPPPDRTAGAYIPLDDLLREHASLMVARARALGLAVSAGVTSDSTIGVHRRHGWPLRRALIHALNNCVDHAAEPPSARLARGKPEALSVTISARREHDRLRLSIEDDGPGIDSERVVTRASALGLLAGTIEYPDAEALILAPGVTGAPEATPRSGRGLGLDAAAGAIAEFGGSVSVTSRPGAGLTLAFLIPLLNRAFASTDTGSESASAA